jgi:3-deoxy-7-phosphoheptulonate synthase
MREPIENRNVLNATPLVSPRDVLRHHPLSSQAAEVVSQTRREIRNIIHGRDNQRLLAVVGPCSIHDTIAAYEYAKRLKRVADATANQLVTVMRTYFEKPRTTVGWKGLINDPGLDGSCQIAKGLNLARALLLKINELGLPCASEMLDPITPQYIADLVSWAAIGARTTESQTHREMASGLSMPVGFKNGTDGGIQVALNAMISARQEHSFLGINSDGVTSVIKTAGNPDRHVVLRGGGGKTNFGPEDIARVVMLANEQAIMRPIMVDCSHDNSRRDYTRQANVCCEILRQIRDGQKGIMGVMLESNLLPGAQKWEDAARHTYGVSITDACIGWEETEALLYQMSEEVLRQCSATNSVWSHTDSIASIPNEAEADGPVSNAHPASHLAVATVDAESRIGFPRTAIGID